MGAAHSFSGGGNVGVHFRCNCCVDAAAQSGAVFASDDREGEAGHVTNEAGHVMESEVSQDGEN